MENLRDHLAKLASLGPDMLRWNSRFTGIPNEPRHAPTGTPFRGLNGFILLASGNDVKDSGYVTENDIEVQKAQLVHPERFTTLWHLPFKGDPVAYKVWSLDHVQGFERSRQQTQWRTLVDRIPTIKNYFELAGFKFIPSETLSGTRPFWTFSLHEGLGKDEAVDPSEVFSDLAVAAVVRCRDLDVLAEYHPQGEAARSYAQAYEALVAEIGGAFLAAKLGFAFKPSDTFVRWVGLVQRNPEVLRAAATDAQLAVDYLDNRVYDTVASQQGETPCQ